MTNSLISIRHRDQEAEISQDGGIVRRYGAEVGGRVAEVLHCPAGSVPWTAAPCFFGVWPLVPFANRAFGGIVDDGQHRFQVPFNDPNGGGNIHGFGWQSVWAVESVAPDRATMVHRREDGPDPYRYVCRQSVSLSEAGLRIDLAVTNEADRPLPYGLGLHPWFPAGSDARLFLKARSAMTFGPGYRPTGHAPLPVAGDFSQGRPVSGNTELVWNFLGWDGTARIEYPSAGLAVTLTAHPAFSSPLLWAPAGADFFCLEPQTHAVGAPSEAVARALTPLARLGPGETLSVWMNLRADPLVRAGVPVP